MHKVDQFVEIISQEISKLTFKGQPIELYEPIQYTMSQGGKRLRPILSLVSCEMFGGDINPAVVPAISLEMFHNFTLIHDDIMDKAPIRRGVETVYKKWDQNIAILSGDTLFALAYEKLLAYKNDNLVDLIHLLNETAIGVCEGQQMDMNFETQKNVTIEEYIEMIRLKTAVLIGACLKAGAIVAKANDEYRTKIYDYGVNVGLAFQLMDDMLDVYGDEVKFGKKPGGDIRENKKTFLYLKALEMASLEDKEKLLHLFSNNNLDQNKKYYEVRAIFDKYQIQNFTQKVMNDYYQSALKILEELPFDSSELLRLTNIIMLRDH